MPKKVKKVKKVKVTKCSKCGSIGVNQSTCPLNLNAKNPNLQKHPKVKIILQKKSTLIKKKKTSIIYNNPYIEYTKNLCLFTNRLVQHIKTIPKKKDIIITGKHLKKLGYTVRNEKFQINIPNNAKEKKHILEYIKLLCDIFRKLASSVPTRTDYFTNPKEIAPTFDLLQKIRIRFTTYLANHFTGNGGGGKTIDLSKPIDDILINMFLKDLPEQPKPEQSKQPKQKHKQPLNKLISLVIYKKLYN